MLDGEFAVSKLNQNSDTLWTTQFYFKNFCSEEGGRLIPDKQGGTYLTHMCNDSIIYFDYLGSVSFKRFDDVDIGGHELSDGNNGFITYNTSVAKRYTPLGTSLWEDGVTFLNDTDNSYSEYYAPDNNGGLIIAYWSTIGGIFIQHSGRNGELGIVTSINKGTGFHPKEYELSQNYPNPFNASTTIRFSIRKKSNIKISITNILGQNLDDLVNHDVSPGSYKYIWDANDYASGVYFYSLFIDGKQVSTKKLLLTK